MSEDRQQPDITLAQATQAAADLAAEITANPNHPDRDAAMDFATNPNGEQADIAALLQGLAQVLVFSREVAVPEQQPPAEVPNLGPANPRNTK